MNCRSGRSTTASHSGPMPELLQTKMKRTPAARKVSASNSPPVPVTETVEEAARGVRVEAADVFALAIGSRAFSAERAAARLQPTAPAQRLKLRRVMLLPR